MIWLCKQTYENPLLMNKIIIHGHRPIPVDVCKEIVHSNKNVINLDTGCVYSNMIGYGTLTSIELNTRSLYFAWVNLNTIFAIRESRINNNGYEET